MNLAIKTGLDLRPHNFSHGSSPVTKPLSEAHLSVFGPVAFWTTGMDCAGNPQLEWLTSGTSPTRHEGPIMRSSYIPIAVRPIKILAAGGLLASSTAAAP